MTPQLASNGSAPNQSVRPYNRPRAQPNPRRDRTISKLAVLKAAAEYAASRPDMRAVDVVKCAGAWLAWVES